MRTSCGKNKMAEFSILKTGDSPTKVVSLGYITDYSTAYTSIDPAPPLPLQPAESPDIIPKLQWQLNDPSLPLFHRYRAMFRLRDLGNREAVLALATGLKDPNSALFRHE